MKRVASDQRLKDLASAGSLASSSDGLLGSSPNLTVLPHSSTGHLGAAADGQQVGRPRRVSSDAQRVVSKAPGATRVRVHMRVIGHGVATTRTQSWVPPPAHAAQVGLQDGDLQFGSELGGGAPLQDADATKLLRELCGDMYIDASQLDQVVSPRSQGCS